MLSGIPKTTWIVEVRKLAVSESPVLSHMLIPVSSTEVKGTQCPEWSDLNRKPSGIDNIHTVEAYLTVIK